MTWTAPGSWAGASNATLFLTNQQVGNLIVVEVINFSNSTVWATGISGGGATWVPAGVKFSGTTQAWSAAVFFGTVTATGSQSIAAPTWSGTAPANWGWAAREFHSSVGSWVFDKQGNLDSGGTANWVSLTPSFGAGELYFGYAANTGSATAGSTAGYAGNYNASVDGVSNGAVFNLNCPNAATFPVWDGTQGLGIMVLIAETPAAEAPLPIRRKGQGWQRLRRAYAPTHRTLLETEAAPAAPVYTRVHAAPLWSASNTSGAALAVTVAPAAIGDLMVVSVLNQGGTSVASLSGGGCASYARVGTPWTDPETPASVLEFWWGVVTSAGSASLAVTFAAAVGAHFNEVTAQDFHSSLPGTWAAEAPGGTITNKTNASSGTVTYPAVTIGQAAEIYCGYASTPSAISTSAPMAGFTAGLTNGNDCFILGLAYAGGGVQPTHGVSLSEASWSVGACFYMATGPATISGGAALAGAGTLTAAATVAVPGAAALAGSGTLAAAATLALPGAAALSGSGTLAAAGGVPSTAPYLVGQLSTNATGTAFTVPVTAGTGATDGIVVGSSEPGAGVISGVTDSRGNTWGLSQQVVSNPAVSAWVVTTLAAPLQAGDSIFITFSVNDSVFKEFIAVAVPGMPTPDTAGENTGSATSAAPSLPTLTLAASGEYALAFLSSGNAGGAVTWTTGTGLLTLHGGAGSYLSCAYLLAPSTSAVTPAGTLTSAAWRGVVIPFGAVGAVAGAAALAGGGGALTAAGGIQGAAALAGSGALTAAATLALPGAASLSGGAGALAAPGGVQGAAALAGAGTLTASAAVTVPGAASLAGTGALTAAAGIRGAASLSGTGALTAPASVLVPGTASLSGAGALTSAGGLRGAAALSGAGALSAPASLGAGAALAGSGTLTAAGSIAGAASLTGGQGTLTAASLGAAGGAASLAGSGALSAAAGIQGAATLAGTGALTAPAGLAGTATLAGGSGALTAPASVAVPGAATLAGSGALGAAAGVQGAAALSGAGALSAPASVRVPGAATLTGAGTLTAAGGLQGAATLSGSGALAAGATFAGAASLSGAGTLSALAAGAAGASLAGTGTLTAGATLGAAASLSGQGSLAAPASLGAAAQLSGQGSLTASLAAIGAATLAGQGALTAAASLGATAALAGQGALSAPVRLGAPAALSGTGVLTASPSGAAAGAAALAGAGLLTAAAGIRGAAALGGAGVLTAGGAVTGQAGATLSGAGLLLAAPTLRATVLLAGAGLLLAQGTMQPLQPLLEHLYAGAPRGQWAAQAAHDSYAAGPPRGQWSAAWPRGDQAGPGPPHGGWAAEEVRR